MNHTSAYFVKYFLCLFTVLHLPFFPFLKFSLYFFAHPSIVPRYFDINSGNRYFYTRT